MAIKFKPSKLSSLSLDKFITTQKNLSNPKPLLWLHHDHDHDHDHDHHLTCSSIDEGVRTLTLNHPILRILDSCAPTPEQFNLVHAQLLISGLFQHPLAASRVVKKLCSSPSSVPHAVQLYTRFQDPDAFICNTILRGFVNLNDPVNALSFYYNEMVGKFVSPNHYTFPLLVKVCADIGVVREGERVHSTVIKLGFEFDLFVRNALIRMYSVFGRMCDAHQVFDLNPESDLVTWNSMIDGYVKNGEVGLARWVFDAMAERDNFSWNSMVAGYAGIGDMVTAKELFENMPYRDVVSWNCIIGGYSRIGNLVAARDCFDSMPFRNVVSWNAMLALYVRSKDYSECLRLFDRMMEIGDAKPNEATIMSVLTACAHVRNIDKGKLVHSYIKSNSWMKPDVLLSTAILTMYSKCGAMDLAQSVFDDMPERSVVSWNSMIMGYGVNGLGAKALQVFLDMERSGQMPNDTTFICILSVCTRAGMILEGWWYFNRMVRVYNIEPKIEHYGCMVDLLGRSGLVKESEDITKRMPMESGPALWGAILSACRTHSDVELGLIVAKLLIELEQKKIGPYILLSNIYAEQGRWSDVENVRKLMTEEGLDKVVGFSAVYIGYSSNKSFQECDSIHDRSMVYSMLKDMGFQMKVSCRNTHQYLVSLQ